MKPITDIYSLLRLEEGDRLYVYDDFNGKPITKGSHVFGNPSIGVGRSLNINGISQSESDELLTHDVSTWQTRLLTQSWYRPLDPIRMAAIIDMTHAMGFAGVQEFADMITALDRQDWQGAKDGVLASKWASDEPQRAQRVAAMLLSGQWPSIS